VNWSDSTQREQQLVAFRAWLPPALHQAPHIDWEHLPGEVMGYLVRHVGGSSDALPLALAMGATMEAMERPSLYSECQRLVRLLRRLRERYGMRTLADLQDRAIWDAFVTGRDLSPAEVQELATYDNISGNHLPYYLSRLDRPTRHLWELHALPRLPGNFIRHSGQRPATDAAAERRRKSRSDVLIHVLPLLVELVQLRKQSAERLVTEVRRQRERVQAGEISLPFRFIFRDRQRVVNQGACTVAEVRLEEREIALELTLWDPCSWVVAHPERYGVYTQRLAAGRYYAGEPHATYDPAQRLYFVQHHGPPGDLLWFGDLVAWGLVGHVTQRADPARRAAAVAAGTQTGYFTRRGGLLGPGQGPGQWLRRAQHPGEQLFEPESLYRGILYGAALATLAMTTAARGNELLQVSAIRWRRLEIPEVRNSQPTGRTVSKAVQMLLPKGKKQERDRQVYLVSDAVFRLLMEIQCLLVETHGPSSHPPGAARQQRIPPGTAARAARDAIPWVESIGLFRAGQLSREPYLFQWGADADGRRGLLSTGEVVSLLQFMLYGLQFRTREGIPFQVSTHLIRHVVATYARHRARIPPEAVAALLHHEVGAQAASGLDSGTAPVVPVATEYYSPMPLEEALAHMLAFQAQLAREQAAMVLHAPTPDDLAAMDASLRRVFEIWGSIGPTPFGWCGAGVCVRHSGRGNCLECRWVLPDFRQLGHLHHWRTLYERQRLLADEQGLTVQAGEAPRVVDWLDGLESVMRIQLQAHLDGGYLPAAEALQPPASARGAATTGEQPEKGRYVDA
jgi:hypothetical protein